MSHRSITAAPLGRPPLRASKRDPTRHCAVMCCARVTARRGARTYRYMYRQGYALHYQYALRQLDKNTRPVRSAPPLNASPRPGEAALALGPFLLSDRLRSAIRCRMFPLRELLTVSARLVQAGRPGPSQQPSRLCVFRRACAQAPSRVRSLSQPMKRGARRAATRCDSCCAWVQERRGEKGGRVRLRWNT